MKLATFSIATPVGRVNRLGALLGETVDDGVVDLTSAFAAQLAAETDETLPKQHAELRCPPDMMAWLNGGPRSRKAAEEALAFVRRKLANEADPRGLDDARLVFQRGEMQLLSPLPRPRSLRDFSVYYDHMSLARDPRVISEKPPAFYKWPVYYVGTPETVRGPEDPVPYPYFTNMLDLEIEVAIVIGKEGRNLTVDQAREHIAGYTIFVDSTCRDGRDREWLGQTKRKNFHSALGPVLVTSDEIDEANLDVRLSVDGETWYEGNTGTRRHYLAEQLVAFLSDNETVYPGDVIGIGTIGASCSMDTRRWIKVGQTATFDVQGIGSMSLKVVEGEHVVDYVNGMKGQLEAPASVFDENNPLAGRTIFDS